MPDVIRIGANNAALAAEGEAATNGQCVNPKSCALTYGYDGSGNVTTITANDGTNTWVKTFTYSGSNVTAASLWVRQ